MSRLVFAFSFVILTVQAQPTSFVPKQPSAGDTIVFTYDPTSHGAKFSLSDDVWIQVEQWFTNHAWRRNRARMSRSDEKFRYSVAIQDGMSFVTCHFVTPRAFDDKADISTMIFGRNSIPVRTANEFQGSYDEELASHPDNYAAFLTKWRSSELSIDSPDSFKAFVQFDIDRLLNERNKNSPEYLYALAGGYRFTGQRTEAESALEKLAALYSDHPLAISALQDYSMHLRGEDIQDAQYDRIVQLKWKLMTTYPYISNIRIEAFNDLGLQSSLSLEGLESLCGFWIAKEPLNPFPFYHLALAYDSRKTKLDQAQAYVDSAISLIRVGMFRVYDDRGGSWEPLVLSSANALKTRIASKLGQAQIPPKPSIAETPTPSFRFSVLTLEGKTIDQAALMGKVVVLNFWFRGCAPCLTEIPSLNQLVSEFQGKDVIFLAVNAQDRPEEIRRFLKTRPFSYNIVAQDTALHKQFGVEVFPTHVILDRSGQVVQTLIGGDKKRHLALAPIIREALGR